MAAARQKSTAAADSNTVTVTDYTEAETLPAFPVPIAGAQGLELKEVEALLKVQLQQQAEASEARIDALLATRLGALMKYMD